MPTVSRTVATPWAILAVLAACADHGDGAAVAQSSNLGSGEFALVHVPGDADVLAINESGIARTVTPGGAIDTHGSAATEQVVPMPRSLWLSRDWMKIRSLACWTARRRRRAKASRACGSDAASAS